MEMVLFAKTSVKNIDLIVVLEKTYCPYADDICDDNCRGCWAYDNEYPLCNLDNETECEKCR